MFVVVCTAAGDADPKVQIKIQITDSVYVTITGNYDKGIPLMRFVLFTIRRDIAMKCLDLIAIILFELQRVP